MSIQDQRHAPLLEEDGGARVLGSTEPDDAPAEAPAADGAAVPFAVRAEMWAMWAMGWPMVVSFMCRILMASTDTAFVGHLTNSTAAPFVGNEHFTAEEYLAAAALCDMVVSLMVAPPLAFPQVLNALVGQALGSGKPRMAGTWLQLSVFFIAVSYIPFLVLQWLFVGDILKALGFDADIAELASHYAKWNVIWPIPNGIYQCMRFYFQAQGLPRPAMYNNIAFTFVNAGLNWLLVFGGPFAWQGFGFVGAAMSISISRCLQPLAYFVYMFLVRRAHRPTWPDGSHGHCLRADRVKSFLGQALPLIGTLIFQSVSGQAVTLLIAQLGSLAVASSSAVAAATQVASSGLSAAFTAVAAVRVGYHLGRGDVRGAQTSAALVTAASLVTSTLTVAVCWPLARQLCALVTDDAETLPVAATLVAASFVGAGLGQLVSIGTAGVLGGQGRTLVTTLLSFGFELPTSIGGVALLVYVAKLRGAVGLLWITWAGAGFSLIEALVVGAIIGCTNWAKCAAQAKARQEGVKGARDEPSEREAPVGAADMAADAQSTIPK